MVLFTSHVGCMQSIFIVQLKKKTCVKERMSIKDHVPWLSVCLQEQVHSTALPTVSTTVSHKI